MTLKTNFPSLTIPRPFMLPILTAIFSFCSFTLFAQTGGLSGVLTDASSGETLPGANIYMENTGIGTVTDLEGEYRLMNVPVGTHEVTFSYIGYETQIHEVEITENVDYKLNVQIGLDAVGLEEVVVTMQMLGQAKAINQQLNSDALVNVVSSDKMKELPDVNAAEAIGRLPGISVQRTGGEASKVVVRGLSPKLTAITINGVRIASTSGTDRSVNLSMIAPELLSSIEVYKSPTADMDGDAVGGIVNLGIAKAPMKPNASIRVSGGFSGLDKEFGNYKGSVDLSKRFLENKLGVYLKANYENMNRSSENISNTYLTDEGVDGDWPITSSNFTYNNRIINRIGSSFGADYQYGSGEIQAQGFYSLRKTDLRVNNDQLTDGTQLDHNPRHSKSDLSVFQGMLIGKQKLSFLEMDWTLAASQTNNDNYYDVEYTINELGGQEIVDKVFTTAEKFDQRTYDYSNAYLRTYEFNPDQTLQKNYTAALNFKSDFNLRGKLSGFVKFGGKYRSDDRTRSVDHLRVWRYYLGDEWNDEAVLNMLPDETVVGSTSGRKIMMENFAPGFELVDIWNGAYQMGPKMDDDYIDLFHERNHNVALANPNRTTPYLGYEVNETVAAGYFMMKLNYANWLSIIPGVRYEHSDNTYSGTYSSLSNDGTGSRKDTTTYQNYGELLPSLHVKVKPLDWFDVRLSAVKTISRPDYNMVTPRARIDLTNARLYRGNPDLKHLEAWNYDATLSFFSNKLGLFTIGGFYKKFDNYFNETDRVMGEEEARSAGLPVLVWEVREDYINFDDSKVYGIEVDMQTNVSSLRAPFNGIVLSANVSRLWSQTFQPLYEKVTVYDPGTRTWIVDVEQSYYKFDTTSLPDQTEWIMNFTIGYDFKGFSARISMIYQSRYLTGLGSSGEQVKTLSITGIRMTSSGLMPAFPKRSGIISRSWPILPT